MSFPIVHTCFSCEYIASPTNLCNGAQMVNFCQFFASCLSFMQICIPAPQLYIPGFIETSSEALEPRGGRNYVIPTTGFYSMILYATKEAGTQPMDIYGRPM